MNRISAPPAFPHSTELMQLICCYTFGMVRERERQSVRFLFYFRYFHFSIENFQQTNRANGISLLNVTKECENVTKLKSKTSLDFDLSVDWKLCKKKKYHCEGCEYSTAKNKFHNHEKKWYKICGTQVKTQSELSNAAFYKIYNNIRIKL